MDKHREDDFAELAGDPEFFEAVFGCDRFRRKQIDETLAPLESGEDFLPPICSYIGSPIIPDVVNFQRTDDLFTIWSIYASVAYEQTHGNSLLTNF